MPKRSANSDSSKVCAFRKLGVVGSALALLFVFNLKLHAQNKKIRHPAQTSTILPGLRRVFHATLTDISIEANPGWDAEESYDETRRIYRLVFSNPQDSSQTFLSCLVEPYHGSTSDSAHWNKLKASIRESYGNRGIAVHDLGETLSFGSQADSSGILARYELLAKHDDYLEYVDAVLGRTELVLVTAPVKPEEYQARIPYLRNVAESLKLHGVK
ncbi:MAG: hypothetical protein Q8916_01805 [Bacteroidota bacterium]|nr:hypothetical protein [Bacteroidota bacterium]MDP4229122.1 hypothetical protein [Bacteroidota bacterium]MDP4235610.1 hypothetical protein [Bacteroidota bacterium]